LTGARTKKEKDKGKRLRFKVKNITGILEFCRDESLGSEQTTLSIMEPEVSINCYMAKACLKKQKTKKKKKCYLTTGSLS